MGVKKRVVYESCVNRLTVSLLSLCSGQTATKKAEPMKTKLTQILLSTFTVSVATLAISIDLNPLMIIGLYSIALGTIVNR